MDIKLTLLKIQNVQKFILRKVFFPSHPPAIHFISLKATTIISFFRSILYINISFLSESLRFQLHVHRAFSPLLSSIYLQGIILSWNMFFGTFCPHWMGLLKTDSSSSCSLTPELLCCPGNLPGNRLKGELQDTHIPILFSPSSSIRLFHRLQAIHSLPSPLNV